MTSGGPPEARPSEPPVYRPFALLAFGSTVLVGVPLGLAMLGWLYLGAAAVDVERVRLHAGVQLFGFFGSLIAGVAHHLLPRFTGRAVRATALTPWLVGLLAVAMALRMAGAFGHSGAALAAGATVQAAAFAAFGVWVWRMLDAPPLRPLRHSLGAATAWLAAACALEGMLRWLALGHGRAGPDPAGLQVVYAMALFGGVIGWVLGVLVRAGPMFVVDWQVPRGLVHAIPATLALAIVVSAAAQVPWLDTAPSTALARLGELLALGTVGVTLVAGGALRQARRALPMASRSAAETRIFRLGLACAAAAMAGAAAATVLAMLGQPAPLVADALRHLVAVGFLTSLVVAMTFRLIPVLEGVPLPWPWLRAVAFWALLGAVLLRTSQVLVGLGGRPIAHGVAASGLLVWVAIACVTASLVSAMVRPVRRGPTGASPPRATGPGDCRPRV
ncbi:MAG: hypothetical protein WED01_02130 [Candidatus Rokuibacteriota bacterium]